MSDPVPDPGERPRPRGLRAPSVSWESRVTATDGGPEYPRRVHTPGHGAFQEALRQYVAPLQYGGTTLLDERTGTPDYEGQREDTLGLPGFTQSKSTTLCRPRTTDFETALGRSWAHVTSVGVSLGSESECMCATAEVESVKGALGVYSVGRAPV